MKKLIIFICFLVIYTSCLANENTTNLINEKILANNNFCGILDRHIYLPSSSDMIYDLETFEYDEEQNKYSIDVFYDFNMEEYATHSPYIKKQFITYLIAKVIIYKTNDKYKIDMKYRGFITADFIDINGTFNQCNVKKYYSDKVLPELKEWYEYFRDNPNNNPYIEEMISEITGIIYNAYKEGKIEDLHSIKSPLH